MSVILCSGSITIQIALMMEHKKQNKFYPNAHWHQTSKSGLGYHTVFRSFPYSKTIKIWSKFRTCIKPILIYQNLNAPRWSLYQKGIGAPRHSYKDIGHWYSILSHTSLLLPQLNNEATLFFSTLDKDPRLITNISLLPLYKAMEKRVGSS